MFVGQQKILLTFLIKNKLRGQVAELVNSFNPGILNIITKLLETHLGDFRDLTSLIQDLQRIRQLPHESPLTYKLVTNPQCHDACIYIKTDIPH